MQNPQKPDDIVRVTRVLILEGCREHVHEIMDRIPDGTHVTHMAVKMRWSTVGIPQLVPPAVPTPADALVKTLERAKETHG